MVHTNAPANYWQHSERIASNLISKQNLSLVKTLDTSKRAGHA